MLPRLNRDALQLGMIDLHQWHTWLAFSVSEVDCFRVAENFLCTCALQPQYIITRMRMHCSQALLSIPQAPGNEARTSLARPSPHQQSTTGILVLYIRAVRLGGTVDVQWT